MSLSHDAAVALIDSAVPATLWLQCHTGDPGPDGTDNIAALSTRESFTRTTGDNPATNVGSIAFTGAPSDETVTHVTAWSASVSGVVWFIELLDSVIVVPNGGGFTVDPGFLSLGFVEWS